MTRFIAFSSGRFVRSVRRVTPRQRGLQPSFEVSDLYAHVDARLHRFTELIERERTSREHGNAGRRQLNPADERRDPLREKQ
jgi:hypothetical protein